MNNPSSNSSAPHTSANDAAFGPIIPFGHGHSWEWGHAGLIKPDYSPITLLGKLIYHRQAPWERRRKTIILLWAITTGLIFGGICVAVILLQNSRR